MKKHALFFLLLFPAYIHSGLLSTIGAIVRNVISAVTDPNKVMFAECGDSLVNTRPDERDVEITQEGKRGFMAVAAEQRKNDQKLREVFDLEWNGAQKKSTNTVNQDTELTQF